MVDRLLAVAAAELRSLQRSLRTWAFWVLAVVPAFAFYQALSALHLGATAPAPRFFLSGYGFLTLWILLAGAVLMAFDARARDENARIAEVLDSRPLSNLMLLGGRLVAIVAAAWVPLLVLAALIQTTGFVAAKFDLDALGEPAEPLSLATFVFLDAPPALLLWGSLTMLLAAMLRNRVLSAVAGTALLGACGWALLHAPMFLLPALSGVANLGVPGSDILPRLPSASDFLQRGAEIAVGLGMLCLAAVATSRRDSAPLAKSATFGIAFLVLGTVVVGALLAQAYAERSVRSQWADAHSAQAELPQPDVERLSGSVRVEPGRRLRLDLRLAIRAPALEADEALRFSLNPGMVVESVRLDDEDAVFAHTDGLLAVTPSRRLRDGVPVVVAVRANGVPDHRFAYLDSGIDALDESLVGDPLAVLGDQASLFEDEYVALMPGVCWLPKAGANFGADDADKRPPDFHEVDLTVHVPTGWHVAAPGLQTVPGAFRIRPAAPIAQLAVIAAPFERRATVVDDVEYALLMHPMHLRNVEHFAEPEGLFREWLESNFRLVPLERLPYPYGALTFVETPAFLRRYGGGWRLDSVQAMPGVQMLPEHGFPTAHLERPSDDDGFKLQLEMLGYYHGPNGIDITAGAHRNMLTFLTSGDGAAAVALNFLVESLTARMVAPTVEAPAAHRAMTTMLWSGRDRWLSRAMGVVFVPPIPNLSDNPALAGHTALAAMNPRVSTDVHDALTHRSNQLADAVYDLLGHQRAGQLLARLRQGHEGSTFTVQDFVAAATATEPSLAVLRDWFNDAWAPGFLVSEVEAYRLPDEGSVQPRFQIRLHVHNDQAVPGIARLVWRTRPQGPAFHGGRAVLVPAGTSVEIGAVTHGGLPLEVRLVPYFSLNEQRLRLPLPRIEVDRVVAAEPLDGSLPSDWRPRETGLLVDDLDPGFSVVAPKRRGFRLRFEDGSSSMPSHTMGTNDGNRWHRQADENVVSWGKYRRTLVRIAAGDGSAKARFDLELSPAGRWRLAYHLPGGSANHGHWFQWGGDQSFGVYDIKVIDLADTWSIDYDAGLAEPGWNDVGVFDLSAGPVRVEVSNRTTGAVVVADAIRWERDPEKPGTASDERS